MKKYDNIIFDVGDVLLEYRWKQMLMDCGLSEEEAIRVGHELLMIMMTCGISLTLRL